MSDTPTEHSSQFCIPSVPHLGCVIHFFFLFCLVFHHPCDSGSLGLWEFQRTDPLARLPPFFRSIWLLFNIPRSEHPHSLLRSHFPLLRVSFSFWLPFWSSVIQHSYFVAIQSSRVFQFRCVLLLPSTLLGYFHTVIHDSLRILC